MDNNSIAVLHANVFTIFISFTKQKTTCTVNLKPTKQNKPSTEVTYSALYVSILHRLYRLHFLPFCTVTEAQSEEKITVNNILHSAKITVGHKLIFST